MDKHVLQRAIAFIDSWLSYRYRRLSIPGFVVAIGYKNELLYSQAFGYANLARKEPLTPDHIFRVASHSKTFAATAVMQLAEKGRLSINDPVAKHIGWLKNHTDRRMKKVTAKQLMSHTAGMIRDGLDSNFWQLDRAFFDLGEFKKELLRADLVYDRDKQMKYSNFGYTVIGCLIEEVSGLSFKDYMQQNILTPLNLPNTGPEFSPEILPRLVTGYTRQDQHKDRLPITEHIDTQAMSAATGFYSTAADLCRYFFAQFIGSGKLLSDASKEEMQRPHCRVKNASETEDYGLGFDIDYVHGCRMFGHGGGFPGQRTRSFCDPERKLIVTVLTNCIDGPAKSIGKGIMSTLQYFEKSAQSADLAFTEYLQRFQGRFTNLWGDVNIVEHGRKLIAIDPDSWDPFARSQEIEVLEQVDDSTWRIESAAGFASEGELVHFTFDDAGRTKSLKYAGADLLSEVDYNSAMSAKKSDKALVALPA